MSEYSLCRKCNSYRPYVHIYCYVCGEELILLTSNDKIKIISCRFCGESFVPKGPDHKTCGNPLCKKLSIRLRIVNCYRRKKGLPNLETFEQKLCSICNEPIPFIKISNSHVKYCSQECKFKAGRMVQKKYQFRRKVYDNGKQPIS